MLINKRKSGTVVMYKCKPRKSILEEYIGYPYCASYKYLGTVLTNHIDATAQI